MDIGSKASRAVADIEDVSNLRLYGPAHRFRERRPFNL